MSSWFMFSALGFYPLAGSDVYIVGSPLYDNVTIHRPAGDLTVTAYNSGTSSNMSLCTLKPRALAAVELIPRVQASSTFTYKKLLSMAFLLTCSTTRSSKPRRSVIRPLSSFG